MTLLEEEALDRAELAERALLAMAVTVIEGGRGTRAAAFDALAHIVARTPIADVVGRAHEVLQMHDVSRLQQARRIRAVSSL